MSLGKEIVTKGKNERSCWIACHECKGLGKKRRRLRKKVRLQYQKDLIHFNKKNTSDPAPVRPKGSLYLCSNCSGYGLVHSPTPQVVNNEHFPHVAIVGGGIGGIALAVACLHRGIPFSIFERDNKFDDRSQGYGLTLQQASKAIQALGITSLNDGIVSSRHVVHNPHGKIIGEWGMRKWLKSNEEKSPRRTNIHVARQSLRLALLEQLGGNDVVNWGHKFVDFNDPKPAFDSNSQTNVQEVSNVDSKIKIRFEVDGKIKTSETDLVIGADGIRSAVRTQLIKEQVTPLLYLGCIVILGICPLDALVDLNSDLLDSATVFQTANGNERIYMMPYSKDSIMWQLSFPMSEKEAKELSAKGAQALKKEATSRTPWHDPIPQIVAATDQALISGYPVYDRELLDPALMAEAKQMTLIGDAAHPMSPFKGQGANQALLDALALARAITKECRPRSDWRNAGIRKSVLSDFEVEMLTRSAVKVTDSAEAADFLHSEVALHEADEPRGKHLKEQDTKRKDP